ncbi:MAG: class I SAM-dependent methyltransferase [Halioglobus sp.]
MPEISHCPLCGDTNTAFFHEDKRRTYLRCARCMLVFVPPCFYLDVAAERAEYDKHRNDVDDVGYRGFLARLAVPLLERLDNDACGLDFGCGPGPALAHMLREAGHRVSVYDPYYAPDKSALCGPYDFVTATEVVEHLHLPGPELTRLWASLKPGGWFGVMTKLVLDVSAFSTWHYKNDPTHVCFFSRQTWQWWARQQGAQLYFYGADVALLRKCE